MNLVLTIINCLLYIIALIYLYKRVKCINIAIYIHVLWTISSACAIYYSQTNMHDWKHNFTTMPFVYIFILYLISIIPLVKLNEHSFNCIKTNTKYVDILAVIISIISIIPFFENAIQLYYTFLSGNELVELINNRYRDDTFDQYFYMSLLGKKLQWYSNNFGIVTNCLLFYYISFTPQKKYIIIGLIVSILTTYFAAYNTGARYIIIKNLLLLIFYYLMFYRFISVKKRKILIKYASIIIGTFIAMTVLISILRYSDIAENSKSDITMIDWLSLYLSEGFLNFNGDMWYIDSYLYGKNTMFLERYILDITQHIEGRDFEKFASIVRIPMHVFYTMIGDFYVDFGPFITPMVIIFISYVFCKLCKFSQNMSLSKLILIGLWGKVCLIGFTYYTYHGDEYQTIFTPLVFVVLYLLEKNVNVIALKKVQ